LEHPTATSLLPLKRISKSLRFRIPNAPVGYTNGNFIIEQSQRATQLSPRKPSPPRGLLRGYSPQKWSHFFAKKNRISNTLSTTRPELRANSRWTRVAKRKDTQVGDSLRLQQDMALLPCHFTYKLLAKTSLPSPNSPRQRKKRRNNATVETKTNTKTYKHSNVLKKLCLLHELHNSSSNKKLKGHECPTTFRARDRRREERPGIETPCILLRGHWRQGQ
jgi:hypothetical protein